MTRGSLRWALFVLWGGAVATCSGGKKAANDGSGGGGVAGEVVDASPEDVPISSDADADAGGAGAGGAGGAAGAGLPPGSGVLQHHNHISRDGVYVDPLITKAAAGRMIPDPTFAQTTYAGSVDAQPLYLDGVDGKPDRLYIATAQNHIHAYDPATGAEAWDRPLGPPGVRPMTVCSPGPWGIIGTPVIDGATRTLYVDAYVTADATTNKHLVFALDADSGQTRPGWPVDVDVKARSGALAFDSDVQNQRGALSLIGGRLFVPYGGFKGDCGAYHGWIVAISTADPTQVDAWATTSQASGIWAPAGVTSDGSSIYFSTGNGNGLPGPGWTGSEAVYRLPLSLARSDQATDFYVPQDWLTLDQMDGDLGSTAPLLVDVPGATPSSLLVALGKDRRAHVLDRSNLGGMSTKPLLLTTVSVDAIITAPVVYTTPQGTYVVFKNPTAGCGFGQMTALKFSATAPPAISYPFCILSFPTTASPAVSMTDAVGHDPIIWIHSSGIENVFGFDGDTGEIVFTGAYHTVTNVARHQAPIIHKGRVFLAANDRLYVFKPSPTDGGP